MTDNKPEDNLCVLLDPFVCKRFQYKISNKTLTRKALRLAFAISGHQMLCGVIERDLCPLVIAILPIR